MPNPPRITAFLLGLSVLIVSLVGCESKRSRQPTLDPADTVKLEAANAEPAQPADTVAVEAARKLVESPLPAESVDSQLDSSAEEYLRRLGAVMRPMRDSLRMEFDRIHGLANVVQRDSAIAQLEERWRELEGADLSGFLTESAFTSRMWVDSIKSADTAFLRRVRQILASGGLFLAYSEGFYFDVDLGARGDLIAPVASTAFAEFLRLVHQGNSTLVHNDAGIVAPLDTLVGRIQGLEAFARAFPGTDHAEQADTLQSFYLHSLICGEQNTRAFINDKPDRDFLAAWRHLAAGPDGPSRRLMRNWLAVLKSEKGRLTPRAKAWLEQRGYSPEIEEDEGI